MRVQVMLNKNYFPVLATVLISLISICGCQTTTNASKCTLPCWEGITPGETTEEEAKRIIEKEYYIKKIEEMLPRHMRVEWYTDDYEGRMIIYDDLVVGIEIWFHKEQLTIGDIVSQIGEPETVEVEYPQQEDQECGVALRFEKRGVVVYYYKAVDKYGTIESSQYVKVLDLSEIGSPSRSHNPDEIIIPWRGFGVKHCHY